MKRNGFTLVELMIVIAIIGILVAVLYPNITGYFARARDTGRRSEVNQIHLAIQMYHMDVGRYRVIGSGHANSGMGWVNFAADDGSENEHQYRISIAEKLQEGGYLNAGIKTIRNELQKRIISHGDTQCNTPENTNAGQWYLYYVSDAEDRYSLSVTLEYPKPKEIEHLKTLYSPPDHHSICEFYGKNYGVGTE